MATKVHSYSESPEISGLLYKKRGGFGKMMPNAWQYRLFIISREGVLCYYDTEVPEGRDVFENKERGRIDLRSVKYELLQEPMEGMPTQYPIVIAPLNEEKWKLCAETKEDQQRWFRVIEKYITDKAKDSEYVRKSQALSYLSDGDDDITPFPNSELSSRSGEDAARGRSRSNSPFRNRPGSSSPKAVRPHGRVPPSHARIAATATPVPIGNPVNSKVNMQGKLGRKKSSKGPLRTSKPTSMFSQEYAETIMVLILINMCIYGAIKSPTLIESVVYVCVMNVVVAHTLSLRHYRVKDEETKAMQMVDKVQADTDAQLAVMRSSISPIEKDPAPDTVNAKPIPGATFQQSFLEQRKSPDHTWGVADHKLFNVRIGPDYNRHKKKAPSAPALYEPFAVDVFCTHKRVDHATQRFQLPEEYAGVNTHNPFVPPVFVLQLQIPSEPPSSLFSSADDGPGWAILLFYRITEDTLNQLKDLQNASPAVKLFAKWCEKAPVEQAWRARFKVINMCTNFDELGFPSAITSYNGKPVLIRRTGTLFRNPEFGQSGHPNNGNRYIEFNIHVHKFANIAKQSIHLITSRCAAMYMMIGFVIEGRENDELPETLFAAIAANKPHQERGEFIFDDD